MTSGSRPPVITTCRCFARLLTRCTAVRCIWTKLISMSFLRQTSQDEQALTLLTPVKEAKGQVCLDAAEQWLSTAVCRVRQPIESFFNGLNEKTGIQCAVLVDKEPPLRLEVAELKN